MREAERAALSAPTIFEGIAQSAERMRHMHQVEGANPSALTICPCGVVQTTCLPLMQENAGAKPVRDAIFIGAWFTGKSRLPPTSSPSKHCQRCIRSVSESA